ncbi:1-acyl-sn-glycerol-3-phosphate acyltransferase [Waterburya agarophytonicola K14]|uniref:1-acyl-sn-glycerol-3-phosphate acyltransferase n=1 Tax=Waterburya agarophytonicola KI4 TaxID=2874699 RepID=A0A964BLA7_9CYAN|nr:lysophospholipid acyltransferase family protein [Waterburya agarophytonicola]MCC0175488.1 1-acyl-sn-glycerol-3-phosphate acyltransferase [Waterburya agarophytonicola KI4]
MLSFTPRLIAQSLTSAVNLQLTHSYIDRIPQDIPTIVVSNHRSFLDAPILIKTIPNTLRIACHHYMGQTPLVREMVDSLGCFPLASADRRQRQFFQQASQLLTSRQWVGLFPEGTRPMIEPTAPDRIGEFHRGFAHLAWKVPIDRLAVLPIAIMSLSETNYPSIPIRWLKQFDRDEPFFERQGLHPMLVYHRVNVAIGRPYLISKSKKQEYKGRQAKILATELTNYCQDRITELLKEGTYKG